ncbi:MAG: HutD family protein [Alphaproteobacteria bacterium]|nr:HutD family protein [Alphaproteobacteria bacterium]
MSRFPVPKVLRRADQRVVPWRNGQGTTREVHVAPGPSPDRFAWRVSIATIDRPGPFSPYPGVDRTIMLIDGAGMILAVDGIAQRIEERFLPFGFRGESTVVCTPLGGRIHDFNVMTDRTLCSTRVAVSRLAEGETRSRPAPGSGLLACLTGKVTVAGADPIALGPWDCLLFDGREDADVTLTAVTNATLVLAAMDRRGAA